MNKGFAMLLYCGIIFLIIRLILSSHQLQGKLLGLFAFALAGVILGGVIHLLSKIFRQSK